MQMVCWVQADIIPDSDTTVLVYSPDGDNPVRVGSHDGEQWCDYNGAPLSGRDTVTHWMDFPDPPRPAHEEPMPRPSIKPPRFCCGVKDCRGEIEGRDGCIFDCAYNKYF